MLRNGFFPRVLHLFLHNFKYLSFSSPTLRTVLRISLDLFSVSHFVWIIWSMVSHCLASTASILVHSLCLSPWFSVRANSAIDRNLFPYPPVISSFLYFLNISYIRDFFCVGTYAAYNLHCFWKTFWRFGFRNLLSYGNYYPMEILDEQL